MATQFKYEWKTNVLQRNFLILCIIFLALVIVCEQAAVSDPYDVQEWFETDPNAFNTFYQKQEDFTGAPYGTFEDFVVDYEKYSFVHLGQDASFILFLAAMLPAFIICGAFQDRTITWSRWAGIHPWYTGLAKALVCLATAAVLEILAHLFVVIRNSPNFLSYFTMSHILRCFVVRIAITLALTEFGTAFALFVRNIILSAVGYLVLMLALFSILPSSLLVISMSYWYLYQADTTWMQCLPVISCCLVATVLGVIVCGLVFQFSCRRLK